MKYVEFTYLQVIKWKYSNRLTDSAKLGVYGVLSLCRETPDESAAYITMLQVFSAISVCATTDPVIVQVIYEIGGVPFNSNNHLRMDTHGDEDDDNMKTTTNSVTGNVGMKNNCCRYEHL
jgi:hypothetical protein